MSILHSVKHAARFSFSPVFSLFHTSAQGEYTLILRATSAQEVSERFQAEAVKRETCGLEIRCDGIPVKLN
jgi:hypothetical protein